MLIVHPHDRKKISNQVIREKGTCKNAKYKISNTYLLKERKMENVQIEEYTKFKARHLRNQKQSIF